jgi:hypothetical protein
MSSESALIPRQTIPSVRRSPTPPSGVVREFNRLLQQGMPLVIAGKARRDPQRLFMRGLRPRHKIRLFDTVFYLTNVRQIPELRFYVGYVLQETPRGPAIYPRIIYKDLSLAWRSASHFTVIKGHIWVGKGDVRIDDDDRYQTVESIESTTDVPLEMQTALERLLAWTQRAVSGEGILELVLRRGPADRVEPYADFQAPRRRAQSNPGNLINGGRPIAWFRHAHDPTSLSVVAGFEPDFSNGVVERARSRSRLYGGTLRRFRILSVNRQVQYYFIAGQRHVWIMPAQATTTELSSYGVRTVDVIADDNLFIPGYEYHHFEETGSGRSLYSQIPEGFAGEVCPLDDHKADATPWLNRIPLIREFRRQLLPA